MRQVCQTCTWVTRHDQGPVVPQGRLGAASRSVVSSHAVSGYNRAEGCPRAAWRTQPYGTSEALQGQRSPAERSGAQRGLGQPCRLPAAPRQSRPSPAEQVQAAEPMEAAGRCGGPRSQCSGRQPGASLALWRPVGCRQGRPASKLCGSVRATPAAYRPRRRVGASARRSSALRLKRRSPASAPRGDAGAADCTRSQGWRRGQGRWGLPDAPEDRPPSSSSPMAAWRMRIGRVGRARTAVAFRVRATGVRGIHLEPDPDRRGRPGRRICRGSLATEGGATSGPRGRDLRRSGLGRPRSAAVHPGVDRTPPTIGVFGPLRGASRGGGDGRPTCAISQQTGRKDHQLGSRRDSDETCLMFRCGSSLSRRCTRGESGRPSSSSASGAPVRSARSCGGADAVSASDSLRPGGVVCCDELMLAVRVRGSERRRDVQQRRRLGDW
jgi:hypothetical protein